MIEEPKLLKKRLLYNIYCVVCPKINVQHCFFFYKNCTILLYIVKNHIANVLLNRIDQSKFSGINGNSGKHGWKLLLLIFYKKILFIHSYSKIAIIQ
jgi:hypothetical protein